MKKYKKIISLVMLMITFISVIQNIVLGATPISSAKLKKGDSIKTNVEFNDGNERYELEANYIYYKDKSHPAYCVSYRTRRRR